MTTETEATDFATFEAAANAGEPDVTDKTENTGNSDNQETNDEAAPLELTEDDELAADEEGDDRGERDGKRRHTTAKQRIAEQRWQIGEKDRRIAELEAMVAGKQPHAQPEQIAEAPDPNDDKYEFGEADPQFIKDTIAHGVKSALAEERGKQADEAARANASETITALDTNWTEQQTKGAEKYEDFNEKIEDFKANAPCPPLVAAAIAHSPVGEDIAYHLATNQTEAKLIAAELLTGDEASVLSACRRFGEIEGQFLDKEPPMPRNGGPLDMAHYAGQLKAWSAKAKRPAELRVTNAPVPPKHGVRGAGGKFQKDTAEMEYKEFEAHVQRQETARR